MRKIIDTRNLKTFEGSVLSSNEIFVCNRQILGNIYIDYEKRGEIVKIIKNEFEKLLDNWAAPIRLSQMVKIDDKIKDYDFVVKFYLDYDKVKAKIVFNDKVLRRANNKKGLKTIRVSDILTKERQNEILSKYQEKVNEIQKILNATILDYVRKNCDFSKFTYENGMGELDRVVYESMETDEKFEYLKRNNFKNLEKFGYRTEQDDGFGHTCGSIAQVSFANKEIFIAGYSSDD